MSTHDSVFNIPLVSSLFGNKLASSHSRLNRRSSPVKQVAICLDDDPLSLRLVEHLLKQQYHVISCATIDSAIHAVKQHRAALFLCDYHLSEDFTGAQAWEILSREHGFNPAHRVLITSYPSPEIERKSKMVGFDCVFAKPLRREFQHYCSNLFVPASSRPVAVV